MKPINKIVLGISLLTSVTLLSSCSKSDSKSNAAVEQARPQQLTFKDPAPGAPLTEAQVDEIKKTFSQKATISVPPTGLLFKDQDSKLDNDQLSALRYQEWELKYSVNPETYAFYKALRAACSKQHGTLNLDVSIPLEKVTSVYDLKTGDHFISSVMGNYGGASCDVEASGNLSYDAKVNHLETDGLASAEVSYGLKALLKNPKYAQMLKSKGIIASSSVSGVVSKQNVNTEDPTDAEANLTFNINGSYFTLTKEIPFTSTYAVYARGLSDVSAEVQTEIKLEINMGSFTANVQAQITAITYKNGSQPNDVETERYFVNGHQMTAKEIQDLFGDSLTSKSAQEVTGLFVN